MDTNNRYYTAEELAEIYRVKPTTVTRWAREGRTEMKNAQKIGKRWLLAKLEPPTYLRNKVKK